MRRNIVAAALAGGVVLAGTTSAMADDGTNWHERQDRVVRENARGGLSHSKAPEWVKAVHDGNDRLAREPQRYLSAIAEALGTSPEQLRAELRSGSSLSELAGKRGLSREQLFDTLTRSLGIEPDTQRARALSTIIDRFWDLHLPKGSVPGV